MALIIYLLIIILSFAYIAINALLISQLFRTVPSNKIFFYLSSFLSFFTRIKVREKEDLDVEQ